MALTRGPLAGATVYVIGTTTTDARGRFVLDSVPDGGHTLTFAHPRFDAAGVQAPQVAVPVAAPTRSRATIAMPPGATIGKAACPRDRDDATGVLIGVVRDAESDRPLPNARVMSRRSGSPWNSLSVSTEP